MIFEQILIFTAVVGALKALGQAAGAHRYDLQQIKSRRQQARHPQARRYRRRPLVSVIIPTHNDESFIGDCLDSLGTSPYRKLEIIVVDSASKDGTRQLVRQFMAKYPKKTIKLCAKRSAASRLQAIDTAYTSYAKGDLVMILDPACQLDTPALMNAVRHFNVQPNIEVLTLNLTSRRALSLAGLFQEFDLLTRHQANKCKSAFNTGLTANTEATVYTKAALASSLKTPSHKTARAHYASDAIVYVSPPLSFPRLLTQRYLALRRRSQLILGYRRLLLPFASLIGVAAIMTPILLSYFIYLAIRLREPELLILSWAVLACFLGFTIWGNDELRLREKLRYILLIPITYGWFYLLSLIEGLAIANSLLRPKSKSQSIL